MSNVDTYDNGDFNADLGRLNQILGNLTNALQRRPLSPALASGTVRDAASFRRRIEEFQEAIVDRGQTVQRLVMADALAQLVQASPVGNKTRWKRNLGKPPDKMQPKNYVGGRYRRSWQVRIGGQVGNDPAGSVMRAVPGQAASLVNLQPYGERLAQGWSSQAPAGWIDAILARVLAKYARVK